MRVGQYVRNVDSESVGRIVRVNGVVQTGIVIITVRWLVSGVRANYEEDRLRVLCPTCAGEDAEFGDDQLARARKECTECGP